jgi:glycosyltransferase involved in cell wall biosynthesis
MKVLVFAHQLVTGGTAVNAIELAAALRDLHGHEVVLFASPGRMIKLLEEKRLRFLPAPDARFHPTLGLMRALRAAVRQERPDILHAWDWWQCVDAYFAVHLLMRVPMVATDMTTTVTRVLPKRLPTTWGSPELVDRARAAGRRPVGLLVPPVDVHLNAPGAVDPAPFRARYGLRNSDITLVTVSRLAPWLKGESLRRTIQAVRSLGRDLPIRLVVVGDGDERAELERLASEANAELGRDAVVFTGMLLDPRPAYAAADIVIGMGSSALRGMAFGKPVIVVGEKAFSMPLTPETAETLYYTGMYGLGDGSATNARLIANIRELSEQSHRRLELGAFSRQFVTRYFSLERVSAALEKFYLDALTKRSPLHVAAADGIRTAAVYLREKRFATPSRSPDPNS